MLEIFKIAFLAVIVAALGIGLICLMFSVVKWMYWEILEWKDQIKDHDDYLRELEEEDEEE